MRLILSWYNFILQSSLSHKNWWMKSRIKQYSFLQHNFKDLYTYLIITVNEELCCFHINLISKRFCFYIFMFDFFKHFLLQYISLLLCLLSKLRVTLFITVDMKFSGITHLKYFLLPFTKKIPLLSLFRH